MSDSQENIEAKLSAYIEGDLDVAGRAEIEQHLAANPSHRKLIDELKRTRDFVRDLPRSKAPSELVETLQGQLERSSLLDGIAEEEKALQIHTSRWPQIISVAAVVLLAAGLATVVYVALPSGADRLAVTKNDTESGALGATGTLPASRPTTTFATITLPGERTDADADTTVMVAPSTTAPVTPGAVAIAATPGALSPALPGVLEPGAGPPVAGGDGVASEPIASVDAAKPDEVAMGAPSRAGVADALATTSPAPAAIAGVTEGPSGPDATRALAASAVPSNAVYMIVDATDVALANSEVANFLTDNRIQYENMVPSSLTGYEGGKVQASSENESKAKASEIAKSSGDAKDQYQYQQQSQQMMKQATQQASQDGASMAPRQNDALNEELRLMQGKKIVSQQLLARNMTRGQVASLQSAVSRNAQQELRMIEPQATKLEDTIRPGDTIEITVDELVGAGVEKRNVTTVGADGNVTMPMVEPVRAAGLTTDELSRSVGSRYRDSSLINTPTVRVARAEPQNAMPTTLPTSGPTTLNFFATTLPSTLPTEGATTRPTPTTTNALDDSPVDLVIIVQSFENAPAEAPIPTTLPTTQSVTTAPSTLPATTAPTTAPAP